MTYVVSFLAVNFITTFFKFSFSISYFANLNSNSPYFWAGIENLTGDNFSESLSSVLNTYKF